MTLRALWYAVHKPGRASMMLTTPQCGEHIVDFATYLRRVQPPVEVDGTGEYLRTLTADFTNRRYGVS